VSGQIPTQVILLNGQEPWYPPSKRLCRLQSWSGLVWRWDTSPVIAWNQNMIPRQSNTQPDHILTALFWIPAT